MLDKLLDMFSIDSTLPITLGFFTIIMVLYSVFVFYFYRFLAKKNIIEINLNQYNQYSSPTLIKIFAAIFYIVEYIILLPILTFFWFSILAVLVLLLSKGLPVETILLISAALVAAVRITSYVSEDLSRDLAKMLPFTLLAIAITTANFFNVSLFVDQVVKIPSLFSNIPLYLFFIVMIELIMRIAEFIQSLVQSKEPVQEEESPFEDGSDE